MRLTEAETGPAQVWVTSPRRCCSNRPRLGDGGRTCGASKALDWGTGPQQAGWVCSGIDQMFLDRDGGLVGGRRLAESGVERSFLFVAF